MQVPNITAAVASGFQYNAHQNIEDISLSLNIDQSSQIFFENIINIMPGNLFWLDKNALAIRYNRNVLSMFGFKSNAEFKGLSFEDMGEVCNWSQEAVHSFRRDSLEVLHSGRAKHNIKEPVITNRNGKPINFLTSRAPICDHNRKIIGIVGVSIDITDQQIVDI